MRQSGTSGRLVLVTAVVAAGLLPAVVTSAAASSGQQSATTRFVQRAAHLPSGARVVRASTADAMVSGAIALQPRDPEALVALATAVSDPRSAAFHHFLGKGEFARRFGPESSTVQQVSATLRSNGLAVSSVAGSGMLLHFRGTVAATESAFHTTLSEVRTARGRVGRMPTTALSLSLPSRAAGQVAAVLGLDTLVVPHADLEHGTHPAKVKAAAPTPIAAASGAPSACAAASDDASIFGGLTDQQIASAYGANGLYTAGDLGAGERVGVYELEPFSVADLKAFDTCYYGATKAASMVSSNGMSVIPVDGGAGSGEGSGESILDVQDVAGIAPAAHIDVYEAPNTATGGLDEWARMINDDNDRQLTSSWQFCELDEQQLEPGYINVENVLFEQAAAQGQSVFADSGDAGSDMCAYHSPVPAGPELSVADPASQPFVTAVGGTTISDADVPPTERVWNDGSSAGAAGGGISAVWSAPSWQQASLRTAREQAVISQAGADGLTPCPAATSGGRCRELPDVSAQADEYTGAITVYAKEFGGWTTFGGTSSSTPLWAAMTALINAADGCPAGGVGFISPELYAVAASPAQYAASFNDVTAGNNDVYGLFGGKDYAAATGFDPASGLGTPILTGRHGSNGLAHYLCAQASGSGSAPQITGIAPNVMSLTPVGSLTISGSNLGDGMTPATVTIGGYTVPAADVTTTPTAVTINPIPTAAQVGTGSNGPQDGAGRYLVVITTPTGASSIPSPAASSVLYVDTVGGNAVPSVSGVGPYGGPPAGGTKVIVFGSGFTTDGGVTGVQVGGRAASYTVSSDTQLKVTVPAYSDGVTECETATNPATDVCQAQVVVANANGPSQTATIRPPLTGQPFTGVGGGTAVPDCVGSTCEDTPATTEYDYLASPTISGLAPAYVSEDPSNPTTATITGSGFDYLGFDWVNIGPADDPAAADFAVTDITPTSISLMVFGHAPTRNAVTKAVTVQTLQGRSNARSVKYAGIPTMTAITPDAGPATGGTAFTITGSGFAGTAPADGGSIQFFDPGVGSTTNQLSAYHTPSGSTTKITGTTPASNPGNYIVTVCTITACSFPESNAQFQHSEYDFFNPGDPVVTSISRHSGPASGGNRVVIKGHNLADVESVHFGSAVGHNPHNPLQLLSTGSATEVIVTAPPGRAGHRIGISVTTVESRHGGHSSALSAADRYTYRASPPSLPRALHIGVSGTSATLRWSTPASNGGHPITGYKVTATPHAPLGHARPPHPTVRHLEAGARRAHLTGLAAGWEYSFSVQAINRLGAGPAARGPRTYLTHSG